MATDDTVTLNKPLSALDMRGLLPVRFMVAIKPDGAIGLKALVDGSAAHAETLLANLADHLRISLDGEPPQPFERDGKQFSFATDRDAMPHEVTLFVNEQPVAVFHAQGYNLMGDAKNPNRALTSSETRMLSFPMTAYQRKYVPASRDYAEALDTQHLPKTDLHTHLSSQMTGEELLNLAIEHDLAYPLELLDAMGIDYEKLVPERIQPFPFDPAINTGIAFECEKPKDKIKHPEKLLGVKLSELKRHKPESYIRLSQLLSIPFDEVQGPDDFDKFLYRYRNPLEKNPVLAKDKILKVAQHYHEQGIEYAELSTGAMLDPKWLEEAIPAIEEAEARYGVKLRLLVGIPRTDPPHKTARTIEKIKFLAQCPYIVGVDFLGFEGNQTGDFSWAIYNLARWARRMRNNVTEVEEDGHFRDNFVIRVHAGENNENLKNVEEVIDIIAPFNVSCRIGHGIQAGRDPQLLKKAKDADVSFEMLPDSWVALDNAEFLHDLPMKKLVDSRVRFFAGSDGAGAYQTDNRQIARSLLASGITLEDLSRMQAREQDYIERRNGVFRDKQEAFAAKYPDGLPQFVSAYRERAAEVGCTDIPPRYQNKIPILVAGASGTSWNAISTKQQREVSIAMEMMTQLLDPKRVFFTTGRVKDRGIEKELDNAIARHDAKQWRETPPFDMIATVAPDEGGVSIADGVTWVNTVKGKALNVAAPVMQFIKERGGLAILGGGKVLTGELIREAKRKEVNYALLSGPEGKAHDAARRTEPEHVIAASAEQHLAEAILQRIYDALGSDVFTQQAQAQMRTPAEATAHIRAQYEKSAKLVDALDSSQKYHHHHHMPKQEESWTDRTGGAGSPAVSAPQR